MGLTSHPFGGDPEFCGEADLCGDCEFDGNTGIVALQRRPHVEGLQSMSRVVVSRLKIKRQANFVPLCSGNALVVILAPETRVTSLFFGAHR